MTLFTLFQDYVDASWAIDVISKQSEQPFFLAVGFYRPHVPFYSPTRVFNEIPADKIELPEVKDGDRDDLRNDPNEWSNLAGNDSLKTLKAKLATFLPATNANPAKGKTRRRKSLEPE